MSQIISLLGTLAEKNIGLLIAQAGLLLIIFAAIFLLVSYLINNKWLEKKIAKFTADSKRQEKLREDEFKQRALLEGEFDNKSKYYKMNKLLQDSGLKDKYPELTIKGFILMIMVYCIIGAIITWIISDSVAVAAIVAGIMMVLAVIILQIKININYVKTEKEIVTFINVLDNMSTSENTIGEMLNKTAPFLKGPLKNSVEQCYFEIKTNGDTPIALKHMAERTSHKKLKEIINSLRVCSTHNENYAEIIEDNRESVRYYIMYKKEKRMIIRNALFETGILAAAGVLIIYMLSTMVDDATKTIFHTLPGLVIIAAMIGIIVYEIIKILKQNE